MIYSKGISWIDDTRIPFVDTEHIDFNTTQNGKVYGRNSLNESITERNTTHYTTKGRFTPNLLVCDDMLNDGNITSQGNLKLHKMKGGWGESRKVEKNTVEYKGDKGSNSRYYDIDLWFNKMIDGLQ